MARRRRVQHETFSGNTSLRLRAAWLYHSYRLTQSEVADQLGVGRSTVIKLLDEARARGEVKVWIDEGGTQAIELSLQLERALGLDGAIVVPTAVSMESVLRAVGLALGRFLSENVTDGMTIGVGSGPSLTAALSGFNPPKRTGVRVLSLVGNALEPQFANTYEFSWRLAAALNADCFLLPAPMIVDSAATRQQLLADRGIKRLRTMAGNLDLAVLSVGDITDKAGSLSRHLVGQRDLESLVKLGCVGDVVSNFLDRNGDRIDHPVNDRVMSFGTDVIRRAKQVVIASGGVQRTVAIMAAIRAVGCNTLIVDELAAERLLDLV